TRGNGTALNGIDVFFGRISTLVSTTESSRRSVLQCFRVRRLVFSGSRPSIIPCPRYGSSAPSGLMLDGHFRRQLPPRSRYTTSSSGGDATAGHRSFRVGGAPNRGYPRRFVYGEDSNGVPRQPG